MPINRRIPKGIIPFGGVQGRSPCRMRTAVAVSGGMDSLLSLALLREEGDDVLAVHAFFLPPEARDPGAPERIAEQCDRLGIELLLLDLVAEFDALVVRPFIEEYLRGKTPNPCAWCNPRMKFGLLFDRARAAGADRLATGHYARVEGRGEGARLMRGHDPAKDQSYFLSMVPRVMLERIVFPLGGTWSKRDVPAALAARGLDVPVPGESQEVCFVPGDDYRAFLEREAARLGLDLPGPGPICTRDGREVGGHRGLWRHTIGQRRGLGVAWSAPLYVLDKDAERNAVVVGEKDELASTGCMVRDPNILVPVREWPDRPLVQTRYRQPARPADVREVPGGLRVVFETPRERPAPGQVCAIYSAAGEVLAGGIIESSE